MSTRASRETPADLVAHHLAKFGAAGRAIPLTDVEAVEHIEVVQDRIFLARHRENAQQFTSRAARAAHFPAANGIAALRGQAAQARHVGRAELSANGRAKACA